MSTENTDNVETQEVDLDAFAAEFFGQNKAAPEPASSEDDKDEPVEDSDAPKEDTHSKDAEDDESEDVIEDDDTLAPDDNDDDDDTDDSDDDDGGTRDNDEDQKASKPKKKNRFQERIDEVIGKQKHTERELQAALAEIERLKQSDQNKSDAENKDVKPEPATPNMGEPKPTDQNEDGTDKYPLGEFDPNYIKDLTKFTLNEERRVAEEKEAQQAQERAYAEQKAELQSNWQQKLQPAQERYPDFVEKGQELVGLFDNIDAAYGEYLESTLMSMDYGPDVLYYLANNTDEAVKIVNSGPTKATIALGRLESKFAQADEQKQKARPKVSKAPNPPPVNKGSSAAKTQVPVDTDDLDAFSSMFFKGGKKNS